MENASKALLIAGAVLLMILLFSLMFYIFSQMAENATSIYSDLEESDITEFNQQFLNYEGAKLNIQDVVTIINIAKNQNENGTLPVTVSVTINWADSSSEITRTRNWQNASVDEINELLTEKLSSTNSYTYSCAVNYRSVDVDGAVDVRIVGSVTITETEDTT